MYWTYQSSSSCLYCCLLSFVVSNYSDHHCLQFLLGNAPKTCYSFESSNHSWLPQINLLIGSYPLKIRFDSSFSSEFGSADGIVVHLSFSAVESAGLFSCCCSGLVMLRRFEGCCCFWTVMIVVVFSHFMGQDHFDCLTKSA